MAKKLWNNTLIKINVSLHMHLLCHIQYSVYKWILIGPNNIILYAPILLLIYWFVFPIWPLNIKKYWLVFPIWLHWTLSIKEYWLLLPIWLHLTLNLKEYWLAQNTCTETACMHASHASLIIILKKLLFCYYNYRMQSTYMCMYNH